MFSIILLYKKEKQNSMIIYMNTPQIIYLKCYWKLVR